MKKIISVFLLALIILNANAQNQQEIDKLCLQLKKTGTDTDRIDILNQLGFLYRQTNQNLAIQYLNEAISTSKRINYQHGLCGAYNRMGLVFKYAKDYKEAIKYFNLSLKIATQIKDSGKIADVYNNIGNIYRISGQLTNATENHINALRLREAIDDTSGIAASYSNLSYVYADQKNYDKAIKENELAIKYYSLAKDSFELARSYSQQGYLYYFQNNFDQAMAFDLKALDIFNLLGDKYETANTLNNIGNILTESGYPEKSLEYLNKASEIARSLQDTNCIFTNNLSLAQSYNALKNYSIAKKYCLEAIAMLKSSGGIVNMYIDAYQLLAEILKSSGDYKNALDAYELHNTYKDSLIQQANNETISELEEKYESDKKDLIIKKKLLELDITQYKLKNRTIILSTVLFIIISILCLGYLYYSRFKLKKENELNEEIIKQKQIRSNAILEAEEKERNRIAKDLHDGLGQQLSAIKLLIQSNFNNINKEMDNAQESIMKLIDDAVSEVRVVSHNMMPNALLKHGLSIAIRELINNITSSGTIKIDLQLIGINERMDTTVELVIYRVLQELINNTIKHSKATKISIQIINHSDGNLNILIEDNGIGFDQKKQTSSDGIGLKNITSRIEYLNGKIHFDTYIGRGTTVIIDIPISR